MGSTANIATGLAAFGAIGYLVYFDYKRRHSSGFRKELRKKAVKFDKEQEKAFQATKHQERAEIQELIETSIQESPLPSGIQAREQFFITEVSRADELLNSNNYIEAALAFYRALLVYPQPTDLLGFYEKSIKPASVLELVRTMVVIRPPPAIAKMVQETINTGGVE